MKKVAMISLVGALGLWACGGGSKKTPDADIDFGIDAPVGGEIDAAVTPQACNPVSGAGCNAGEKCSWNSATNMVVCAPNGTVGAGEACTVPMGGGVDDCVARLFCDGTCKEICSQTPADTCSDGSCIGINGIFDDNTGVCLPACNILAQDCEDASDGCYLGQDGGVCANAGDLGLGDTCGFLNDCAPGSACLTSDMGATFTCVALCDYVAHMDMGGEPCKPAELCCGITDVTLYGACVETTDCNAP